MKIKIFTRFDWINEHQMDFDGLFTKSKSEVCIFFLKPILNIEAQWRKHDAIGKYGKES